MRTALLSSALAFASFTALGQTYYYVNAIDVDPSAPTTSDAITLHVHGDLSNTAASIASFSYQLVGNTVDVTIIAEMQGFGLDILVPHDVDIPIGMLAAGNYTISLHGTAIQDMASSEQHHFTVTESQSSPCDSLLLDHIWWAPFSDTAVEVHVFNHSSELFDYPGFQIVSGGDTLAHEMVNYFGIAQESTHLLAVAPGAPLPDQSFNAQLQLWTGFYAEEACTFDLTFDLCPPAPCTPLVLYLNNFGDQQIDATIDWQVVNADNNEVVVSGSFVLADGHQSEEDTVCLPPGNYRLQALHDGPTGGQPYLGVTTAWMSLHGMQTPFTGNADHDRIDFTFYGPCISGITAVGTHPAHGSGLELLQDDRQLTVRSRDGRAIGAYEVYDMTGRRLAQGAINGGSGTIGLSLLPRGAYILRAAVHGAQRFIH